jgi:hypothetical protein
MSHNPHKAVSANSKGIVISFRDVNKHKFIAYESPVVKSIQISGTAKYQKLERPAFNRPQQKLYAEVIYGLNVYTHIQVKQLSKERRIEILERYNRAQDVLNEWKKQIVDHRINNLLTVLFPNSVMAKKMCEIPTYDRHHKDTHTFKELGLTQEKIASKLVEVGILPTDFFNLT